jgi:osomolarity two-component system sensor histidine kinase TcsA
MDIGWRYRKDGSRFQANVTIAPIFQSGELIGFSKVTRDLTASNAEEARLKAAYEESSKIKSEFLANMSHEIRTPMHGMLSALTLLIQSDLNEEQKELAGIIKDSGGVMMQVINDILDYSKLAAGSFAIRNSVISLQNIVSKLVKSFSVRLQGNVQLLSTCSADLPLTLEGDDFRYGQILRNLVGNAVKFTDFGQIKINVSVQEDHPTSCVILTEISDSGTGVDPNSVAVLFTPFTQFDSSTTKQHQGTGLGLSICKSLCEIMGGQIGYRSNSEHGGSTFWFTVTMAKCNEGLARKRSESFVGTPIAQMKNSKIL